MSRNLGRTDCAFCDGYVALEEAPREVRPDDVGGYFDDYVGMIVAFARCEVCEAPYLAWIDGRKLYGNRNYWKPCFDEETGAPRPIDLSHRSTFNDEPGWEDYPRYKIEIVRERKPWPTCARCGKPESHFRSECVNEYEHEKEDKALAKTLGRPPPVISGLSSKDHEVISDWYESQGHVHLAGRVRGPERDAWLKTLGFIDKCSDEIKDVDGRTLQVGDLVEIVDEGSAQQIGLIATIDSLPSNEGYPRGHRSKPKIPSGYVDLRWNEHPSGGANHWLVLGRFVRLVRRSRKEVGRE